MDMINDVLKAVTGTVSGLWPQPAEKPERPDGKLRPCSGTPNCVCSDYSGSPEWIEPIAFKHTKPDDAWALLKQVIDDMDGEVQSEQKGYLWSTFTVPLFGFTDDVEFRLDETAKVIQVRSASRLGFSDLGVNRGRVEEIRRRFSDKCQGK